ncbi:DDE-type integrase/transposase/recombinase [Cryptosporangium japonicum]|uniref:Integrase catalytic domain-containing protein n=1 Tax=Cryptosporangium japonicum TaxID=80872 RepID=A0ABN0TJY9_9ACTN
MFEPANSARRRLRGGGARRGCGLRIGRRPCAGAAGQGRQGTYLRRGWKTGSTTCRDPNAAPAADLVERDFTAGEPNRLWVADATRIPCGQGAFWLAAVRDAYSRRIVGRKTSDRCDTDLVLGALEYAVWTHRSGPGQLLHHNDHGSNYTSFRFGQTPADLGITASMGTVGDSYGNALTENFFLR